MFEKKMKNAYTTNFSVLTHSGKTESQMSHVVIPKTLKQAIADQRDEEEEKGEETKRNEM